MKKLLSIVGARPQFIKLAAMHRAISENKQLLHIIVHSGQHYDHGLSGQFFAELDIPVPNYNIGIGSGHHNIQMAKCIIGVDEILEKENPDIVIVYGDTNTTSAAAIATAKRCIPLAHVEAGLREWDKSIPEEVNKLITDALADLYFTPTKTGKLNLANEGKTDNVFITGDISLDLLYQPKFTKILDFLKLQPNEYIFVTCHRAANTDNKKNLEEIVNAINELKEESIFAIHPRTCAAMQKFDLKVDNPNVTMKADLGFWDAQTLIKNARFVLTDSGGVIKEAYFHKVPAVILDTQTEWVETVEEGWNTVVGPNADMILRIISEWKRPMKHTNCLGDGNAGEKMVREILKFLNTK